MLWKSLLNTNLIATSIGGVLSFIAGMIGLYRYSRAQWFTDPGGPNGYAPTWVGYTVTDFCWLVTFGVCAPTGFLLLHVSFHQTLKALEARRQVMGYVCVAAVYLVLLGVGLALSLWHSSNPLLTCFYVGCTDPTVYKPLDPPAPEAGYGWLSVVASLCFIVLCGTAMSFIVPLAQRGVMYYHNKWPEPREVDQLLSVQLFMDPPFDNTGVLSSHRQLRRHALVLLTTFLVLSFIFFFVATTTIPNSWEYFMADRIASYAATTIEHNQTICAQYPPLTTCPEMDNALMRTTTITVKPYWILKFFPSNVIFYSYLFALCVCGAALRFTPGVRARLQRPLVAGASLGEVLSFAVFALALGLWAVYWLHDHNFNGYWPFPPAFSFNNAYYCQRVARSLGQCAVFVLGLLFFPASRNSVFGAVFDVPWEQGIRYHRYLGTLFLAVAVGHMITTYSWFYYEGKMPENIFRIPLTISISIDNFTVPYASLVLWTCSFLFGLGLVTSVRRKFFELFYYSHMVGIVLLVPAVLWHAAAGWEYLVPGVMAWFVDRCVRVYRSSRSVRDVRVRVLKCGAAGTVTEVTMAAPFEYRAGQYCFLNVAEVSVLEWHPFTVSSSDARRVTLHIKDMGAGTFTSRLREAAFGSGEASPCEDGVSFAGKGLTVSVDGPYGTPLDYHKYHTIVLVAGGIGVTPVKSIFESLVASHHGLAELRAVHLVWVARDVRLFSIMSGVLSSLPNTNIFHASLYLHSHEEEISLPDQSILASTVTLGKPHFEKIFGALGDDGDTRHTLVFACAPEALTTEVSEIAAKRGSDFHTEVFLL